MWCKYWIRKCRKSIPSLEWKSLRHFTTFLQSEKTEILSINELRTDGIDSKRSTLFLRIKKPKNFNLWPACNINVYPLNIFRVSENEDNKVIEFKAKKMKMNLKVPFPPMKISELKKLVNLRQKASNKLIQNAILLSNEP